MDAPVVHRMADPAVRIRVAFMLVCLVALSWVSVSLLGRPTGPFGQRELPDLAGLPILVPQIEQLVPPRDGAAPEASLPDVAPPAPTASQGVSSP